MLCQLSYHQPWIGWDSNPLSACAPVLQTGPALQLRRLSMCGPRQHHLFPSLRPESRPDTPPHITDRALTFPRCVCCRRAGKTTLNPHVPVCPGFTRCHPVQADVWSTVPGSPTRLTRTAKGVVPPAPPHRHPGAEIAGLEPGVGSATPQQCTAQTCLVLAPGAVLVLSVCFKGRAVAVELRPGGVALGSRLPVTPPGDISLLAEPSQSCGTSRVKPVRSDSVSGRSACTTGASPRC